jgi:hypothetical protein
MIGFPIIGQHPQETILTSVNFFHAANDHG